MFRQLSVPTPFQVGPVNAYLAGRTLVDPGPDSDEAWSTLLEHLESQNLAPEDIEQVLVTHPHPDHFGLAKRFSDLGARIVASEEATTIVEAFESHLEFEQSYFLDFFERCGMARTTAQTVTNLPDAFLAYAPSVDVEESVTDHDSVVVNDTALDVSTVTGHAAGEVIFAFDTDGQRRALVGDNVLPDITPNPFLLPAAAPDEPRPRVLPAYNDSLDALQERPFDRFLPGHREVIENPADRISEIRQAHEDRTANVADIVDGPMTPVEVMEALFGDLPATEMFSGMSEAVGHLDVLEARGQVRCREDGGLLVYEPTQ